MTELVVPIDEGISSANRIINGIVGLHFDPKETKITILNVFKEFEVDDQEWSTIKSDEFYDEEQIPESVSEAATELSDHGYSVTVRREHGDPSQEIVQLADELEANAIVISGRQRSPVGKVLLGSVTQAVLLHADQPVVVIPKSEG